MKGNGATLPAKSPLALTRAVVAKASAGGFGPYLTRDEVRRLLESLEPASRLGSLARFLWQSGARISEALDVRVSDIDFGACLVRVRTLKRRKRPDGTVPVRYRMVPIQPSLIGPLGQRMGFEMPQRQDRLWPWTRQHAARLLVAAMLAVDIPREKAHPHALRHAFAINCIMQGVPLNIIQQQLDHSSIQTTSIYLQATVLDRKASLSKVDWE